MLILINMCKMVDFNDKYACLTGETGVVAPTDSMIQLRKTTIVPVAHNENRAAYGRQIIRLKDRWMEK